jgi:S-adenosylmethionine uptake transporter
VKAYSGLPALPFFVTALGIGTFAGMDALMKGLSLELGAYNAVLWRTFLSIFVTGVFFLVQGARIPERATLRIHVLRGLVISVMAFLFFWGLARVPLAEAIALSFIAPLIALYLAAGLLGEHIGRQAVFASLLGFGGALVIIAAKLGGELDRPMALGIVAIVLSAVLYAYNLILQRRQALLAGPVEIAFFQNTVVFCVYLALAPWLAVVPGTHLAPAIAGASALSIVSILLLSWAYARAEARMLIPVEYTAFIWAALLGWVFFAEAVTAATLAGTALIVLGCLIAMRQTSAVVTHVEPTAA